MVAADLCDVLGIGDLPDIEHAVRRLMSPENTLETFTTLAGNDSVLMQRVLQGIAAKLVNVQSVEAEESEMKRRAVVRN